MIELKVEDMTCGHCVTNVTRAIKTMDADATVQVDLGTGRVRVDGQSSAQQLIGTLAVAGYSATPTPGTTQQGAKRSSCCCG